MSTLLSLTSPPGEISSASRCSPAWAGVNPQSGNAAEATEGTLGKSVKDVEAKSQHLPGGCLFGNLWQICHL